MGMMEFYRTLERIKATSLCSLLSYLFCICSNEYNVNIIIGIFSCVHYENGKGKVIHSYQTCLC